MNTRKNHTNRLVGALVVGAILALLAGPVILFGQDLGAPGDDGVRRYTTGEAYDANDYHLPVVRAMAAQWPGVNIRDYNSATAPGYHLLLAGASRAGVSDEGLRGVTLALSVVFVGAAAWFASALAGWKRGVALCLPLVASSYVLAAASWMTTDNAALGMVAIAVGCAAFGGGLASKLAIGGLGATLAVATRQIHIWTIAPLFVAACAGAGATGCIGFVRPMADRVGLVPRAEVSKRDAAARLVVGAFACLAPLALLGWFAWMWGGLIPPSFVEKHASGVSLSVPALALSLAAIFGAAFVPAAWEQVKALRARDPIVLGTVALGLFVALAPSTAWDADAGRKFGWLWEVVRRAPSVGDRSVVFVALAPVGALVLLLLWRAAAARGDARARCATILLVAGACWCAAQMANSQAWQRYVEPPVLCGVIWLAACAQPSRESVRAWPAPVRVAWLFGPVALAGMLLVVSAATIYLKVL